MASTICLKCTDADAQWLVVPIRAQMHLPDAPGCNPFVVMAALWPDSGDQSCSDEEMSIWVTQDNDHRVPSQEELADEAILVDGL